LHVTVFLLFAKKSWYSLLMAKLGQKEIRSLAKQIILDSPGGIKYSQLKAAILSQHPETPENTIEGSIWDLATRFPNEVVKPSRGLFKAASAIDAEQAEATANTITTNETPTGQTVSEEDFYRPFADWLKNDLDEATIVEPLGGAGLKGKWGTPDVVGVYKPLASNLIRFPMEIVTGEVKIAKEPVVAFGQAVAYRLFSAKTYIAMPKTLSEEDQSRLETLCMLFGVGLALFKLEPKAPDFTIRVRAQRFSPDMFYVNEFADRLKSHDPEVFQKLFG
jgi:hypothetical protein